MENSESTISREVAKEIVRLFFFIVYYVALIVFGAAVLVGSFYSAKWLYTDVMPNTRNLKLLVLTVVAAVGILAMAAVFGIYLIKPLFSFTRDRNDARVEVRKQDCPKLFALLEKLAAQTGFRLPKRVYLTTDVNACVFYDTSFWSIFSPVRKNLEIGLGILNSTSVQEVKAILAHEFGHFGQNSMKVGSAVAVTNQVLVNLIYTDDVFDRIMEAWCNAPWESWRIFGSLADILTGLVKRLTFGVFKFVQKGYMNLSRLMEFGADAVACECAGTQAFVSAMCKIDVLSECDDGRLRPFLQGELADKRCPENYFMAHDALAAELCKYGWQSLDYSRKLTEPVNSGSAKSRIKVRDVWSSHPDLEDRLAHATGLSIDATAEEGDPAWSLVPAEISQRVSDRYFEILAKGVDSLEKVDAGAFRQKVKDTYEEQAFPRAFDAIFSRGLESFDWEKASNETTDENPFTLEYERLVYELMMAKADMSTLEQIVSGEIEACEFTYDGVTYKRKAAPVEEHARYLDGLKSLVADLDARACSYLCSLGTAVEKEHVISQYRMMAEIGKCFKALDAGRTARDARLKKLFQQGPKLKRSQYNMLCAEVVDAEKELKSAVHLLRDIVGESFCKSEGGAFLLDYAAKDHNGEQSFDSSQFQQVGAAMDVFMNECNGFYRKCSLNLARFASEKIGALCE